MMVISVRLISPPKLEHYQADTHVCHVSPHLSLRPFLVYNFICCTHRHAYYIHTVYSIYRYEFRYIDSARHIHEKHLSKIVSCVQ